jgi:ferredoxin-1, mitochondrial
MNTCSLITRLLVNRTFSSFRSLTTASPLVNVKIIDRDQKLIDVKAKVGTNMLDVILDNKIDVDGFGACEGTLACSTCHVILDSDNYKTLPEPVDEENDMLDLAFGLTPTSRLACQIIVEPRMNDWTFVVPKVTHTRIVHGDCPSTCIDVLV